MLHTTSQGQRPFGPGEEKFFKGFYPIWAWRPYDLDRLNKLSFPHPMEAPHEMWLQSAQWFLPRRCLKMLTHIPTYTRTTKAYLYYKAFGSGKLKSLVGRYCIVSSFFVFRHPKCKFLTVILLQQHWFCISSHPSLLTLTVVGHHIWCCNNTFPPFRVFRCSQGIAKSHFCTFVDVTLPCVCQSPSPVTLPCVCQSPSPVTLPCVCQSPSAPCSFHWILICGHTNWVSISSPWLGDHHTYQPSVYFFTMVGRSSYIPNECLFLHHGWEIIIHTNWVSISSPW